MKYNDILAGTRIKVIDIIAGVVTETTIKNIYTKYGEAALVVEYKGTSYNVVVNVNREFEYFELTDEVYCLPCETDAVLSAMLKEQNALVQTLTVILKQHEQRILQLEEVVASIKANT